MTRAFLYLFIYSCLNGAYFHGISKVNKLLVVMVAALKEAAFINLEVLL